MIRWLPWILFGSALLAAFYSFFMLLNGGAALNDARTEIDRLRERSTLALSVIQKDWIGKDASELSDLYRLSGEEGIIVKHNGDTHEIGDIIFKTENGIVVDVRYFD